MPPDVARHRHVVTILFSLVVASVFATVAVSNGLMNPFATTKALWLRSFVIVSLPFYTYLLFACPSLRPSFRSKLTVAVVAFLLLSTLAAACGVNPSRSFWGTYTRMGGVYHLLHLTLLHLYLVQLAQARREYLRIILILLVWIAAISAAFGIKEGISMPSGTPAGFLSHRVSSIYGNPIFFASFLILPMALTLFYWRHAGSFTSRLRYIFLLALQLLGLMLTGTRGALLAVLVGLTFAAIALGAGSQRSRRRTAAILLGGSLVALSLLLLFRDRLPPDLPLSRFANFQDRTRILAWRAAWRGFVERPLMGFGPENYYVLANKYFDREMYEYYEDTLFDKPHNHVLELLATTGVAGLLAYAVIFVLTVYTLWAAFRSGRISWDAAVILATGIIAYHIQNCFVFDTQAASIAFYAYTAFIASMWPLSQTRLEDRHRGRTWHPVWAKATVAATAAACAFAVIVTDGFTALTLRQLKNAYSFGLKDMRAARASLDRAAQLAFVYDRPEIAKMYREFAVRVVEDVIGPVDVSFANSTLDAAAAVMSQSTAEATLDPEFLTGLAYLYYEKSNLNGTPVDARGYTAIGKAVPLEPDRVEPLYLMAQYYALDHRPDEAVHLSEHVIRLLPRNAKARWQLALVYKSLQRDDLAAQAAEQAMQLGYALQWVGELQWLIDYYSDRRDYDKAAELYKKVIRIRPGDYRLYLRLAQAYGKLGAARQARNAAQQALQVSPLAEQEVKEFLRSL